MAVIQISKIQLRRGQKNSQSGIPQLSSAEMAWAIDTQELFIGNGSISEGAPYVGNTKIITEHDNILDLASGYTFGKNDLNIIGSKNRTLQDKLDELEVSVVDLGAVPDSNEDSTEAFETAFTTLFRNINDRYKRVLKIPNGTYNFLSDLKIPSWATLVGENQNKTVLNIGDNNIAFISEDGTESGNFTSSDLPKNVRISNLTINHAQGETVLTGCQDFEFEKVIWRSDYVLGDTGFQEENPHGIYNIPIVSEGGRIEVTGSGVVGTVTQPFTGTYINTLNSMVSLLNSDPIFSSTFLASRSENSLKISNRSKDVPVSEIQDSFTVFGLGSSEVGQVPIPAPSFFFDYSDGSENVKASVFWQNVFFGTRTDNVKFKDCDFVKTRLAIECQHSRLPSAEFGSSIQIEKCNFIECDTAIYLGGVQGQINDWKILECSFEQIASKVLVSTGGQGTQVLRSNFKNCGNGTNSSDSPISSIVSFSEMFGNVAIDCSSDRHQSAFVTDNSLKASVPEFENCGYVSMIDRNYALLSKVDGLRTFAIFPATNRFIVIDYFLSLGTEPRGKYSRVGRLTITMGDDLAGTDGLGGPGEIGNLAITDSYQYSPSTTQAPGGTLMTNFEFSAELRDNDSDSGIETILLRYRNPVNTGEDGFITYSVAYGV